MSVLVALAATSVGVDAQSLSDAAAREKQRRAALPRPVAVATLPGAVVGWRTFTSETAGFTASFPASVATSDGAITTAAGTLERRVWSAEGEMKKYVVMVTRFPLDHVKRVGPHAIFDEAERQALVDFQAKPFKRYPSGQGAFLGRDFELQSTFTSEAAFLKLEGRMILAAGRLYVAVQLVRNGGDPGTLSNAFLGSFDLIPGANDEKNR